MPPTKSPSLVAAFHGLRISTSAAPLSRLTTTLAPLTPTATLGARAFSISASRCTWIEPRLDRRRKKQKGRPRVPTGGSSKGTTVQFGDWGLRMVDYHRRISAKQLKDAVETIRKRLQGQRYKLYPRVCCNHGVFTSGNEVRMGKGKGSFDHWSTRVAINQIVFELKGMLHEQVARDAFRLAGHKLPGVWRFVVKGEPPVVGKVHLKDGVTLDSLKNPRKAVSLQSEQSLTAPAPHEGKSEAMPPSS